MRKFFASAVALATLFAAPANAYMSDGTTTRVESNTKGIAITAFVYSCPGYDCNVTSSVLGTFESETSSKMRYVCGKVAVLDEIGHTVGTYNYVMLVDRETVSLQWLKTPVNYITGDMHGFHKVNNYDGADFKKINADHCKDTWK